jgi:hypothetical protein
MKTPAMKKKTPYLIMKTADLIREAVSESGTVSVKDSTPPDKQLPGLREATSLKASGEAV